jgi:hypothetical protein
MDISTLGSCVAIVMICYIVGMGCKASKRISYPVASFPIGLSAMSATSCLCFYFTNPCTAVFSFSGIEPFSLYLSMR